MKDRSDKSTSLVPTVKPPSPNALAKICNEYDALLAKINRLTSRKELLRKILIEYARGQEIGNIKVVDKTARCFDRKGFKADHPTLYDEYIVDKSAVWVMRIRMPEE